MCQILLPFLSVVSQSEPVTPRHVRFNRKCMEVNVSYFLLQNGERLWRERSMKNLAACSDSCMTKPECGHFVWKGFRCYLTGFSKAVLLKQNSQHSVSGMKNCSLAKDLEDSQTMETTPMPKTVLPMTPNSAANTDKNTTVDARKNSTTGNKWEYDQLSGNV